MASFKVTITDPIKHSDNYGGYMTYRVNTTGSTNQSVVRRFSDFTWLQDQLAYNNPGCIIPPLPEKAMTGKFTPEFVEARRRGLEMFTNRVINHTELSTSKCFVDFLSMEESSLSALKDEAKKEKDSKKKSLTSWFETKVHVVTSNQQQANVERTAADLKFEEIIQYVTHLETQLAAVAKHSSTLVKRNKELAGAMFEYGQAFTWLGQSEGESLGSALTQMGSTADQVSVLATESAEAEALQVEESLHEYVRLLASVKAAMNRRAEKKKAYLDNIQDLDARQAAYNKMQGTPGKEEAAQNKLAAVEKAQQAVDESKVVYEDVSEKLLVEFDKFKKEKTVDIKTILLKYVNLQVEYNKKAEKSWADLVPSLQKSMNSAQSSNPFGEDYGGGSSSGFVPTEDDEDMMGV